VEKAIDAYPGVSSSAVFGVTMPGSDGKAGMAAIVRDAKESFDLDGLADHLRKILPKYAVPLFVRFVADFEWTATHKIKKTNLKNEGYDPALAGPDLYVLLPDGGKYEILNQEILSNIKAGKYRF
jgi:acyl-CoA synthetase (AMP-forming)/AMP-acid ligase II